MVKINRKSRAAKASNIVAYTFCFGVCMTVMLTWYRNTTADLSLDLDNLASLTMSQLSSSQSGSSLNDNNSQQMKQLRQSVRTQCQQATTAAQVESVAHQDGFQMPATVKAQPRGDAAVTLCRRVVMDFGANIGDTSGHVMDAGMVSCDRSSDLQTKTKDVHFNVKTKQFEQVARRNPLTQHLVRMMSDFGGGPEDYCYYGVEGNPVFTRRLQDIEDYVMAIEPRPIQHMHFFIESVGAGEDGMTKLYLDTVNTAENFWGSSIYKDHQDVRKSNTNSTQVKAADVMGYTIGTLMRKTLKAFDPHATTEEKKGNHLVLKVDIEGGEYPLLDQAVKEGTLCEFVKMGNKADLFIEFHSQKVTGRHSLAGKTKANKDALTKCGVVFRNLQAWWA